MVPRRVLFTDHLARSPNGKIDRRFLAESLAGLFEEDGG
jgi:acyl-coenzyme A synthetase/AMP-(fatty) acid ligase